MTTASLPIAVLLALEDSCAAHLRTIRQAVHVAQSACLHADSDDVPPADAEDVPLVVCRACRMIRSSL